MRGFDRLRSTGKQEHTEIEPEAIEALLVRMREGVEEVRDVRSVGDCLLTDIKDADERRFIKGGIIRRGTNASIDERRHDFEHSPEFKACLGARVRITREPDCKPSRMATTHDVGSGEEGFIFEDAFVEGTIESVRLDRGGIIDLVQVATSRNPDGIESSGSGFEVIGVFASTDARELLPVISIQPASQP